MVFAPGLPEGTPAEFGEQMPLEDDEALGCVRACVVVCWVSAHPRLHVHNWKAVAAPAPFTAAVLMIDVRALCSPGPTPPGAVVLLQAHCIALTTDCFWPTEDAILGDNECYHHL